MFFFPVSTLNSWYSPSLQNTNSRTKLKAIQTQRDTFHKITTSKHAVEASCVFSPRSLCRSAIFRNRIDQEKKCIFKTANIVSPTKKGQFYHHDAVHEYSCRIHTQLNIHAWEYGVPCISRCIETHMLVENIFFCVYDFYIQF